MKRFFIYLFCIQTVSPLWAPQFPEPIIVLAPYADPKNPGRIINGTFERGIALQCAEKLSAELMTRIPEAHIIILGPEENQTHLQATSYANRLQPTLFCTLSFYQETSPQPHIHLYRYLFESDLPLRQEDLALYPYDQVHRLFSTTSRQFLSGLYEILHNQANLQCDKPSALPLQPLLGIAATACTIEIGIPKEYSWQALIEPLATGIAHALTH